MATTRPAGASARAGRGQTPQGQDRRTDIVRSAKLLFAERGYTETRMADIADEVGITKGLLYWYFESKEALIAEILVDLRERLRFVQHLAVADLDDPLARLYVGTIATVRYVLRHYRLYSWTALGPDALLTSVATESGSVHATDTAATIAEGQRRGIIHDDTSPQDLALSTAGIVDRICFLADRGTLSTSAADAPRLAARLMVRSLAKDVERALEVEHTYGDVPTDVPVGVGAPGPGSH